MTVFLIQGFEYFQKLRPEVESNSRFVLRSSLSRHEPFLSSEPRVQHIANFLPKKRKILRNVSVRLPIVMLGENS